MKLRWNLIGIRLRALCKGKGVPDLFERKVSPSTSILCAVQHDRAPFLEVLRVSDILRHR